MFFIKRFIIYCFFMLLAMVPVVTAMAQTQPMLSQYPSPMRETIRKHERVKMDSTLGKTIEIETLLARPVVVYLPEKKKNKPVDLLIHFHGSAGIVAYAAEAYKGNIVTATINLGSGSGVYARAFENDSVFLQLEENLWRLIAEENGKNPQKGRLILSGFSAGYGAIRSILKSNVLFEKVTSVILLDGLHSSYIPERTVLAEGGAIDTTLLQPFVKFAAAAINKNSDKKFLFTHSEIFPGTFVSTTECAHYLLTTASIKALPVLKQGPLGMQQISQAEKGSFSVLGFAGNSAPDHVDHFHALYYFLNRVRKK